MDAEVKHYDRARKAHPDYYKEEYSPGEYSPNYRETGAYNYTASGYDGSPAAAHALDTDEFEGDDAQRDYVRRSNYQVNDVEVIVREAPPDEFPVEYNEEALEP